MMVIKKIDKHEFDLGNYVMRLGDCASYNTYYSISIDYNNELIYIGLQMPDTGIGPQVAMFNSHIIIGVYKDVYIWKPTMTGFIRYEFDAPFYEFYIVNDNIIILHELGVVALNGQFDKKWEKSFSEIIDIEKIDNKCLILKDLSGSIIKLDVSTGDRIC